MEFEKIQHLIASALHVSADDIKMDTKFSEELGADSLDLFRIMLDMEQEFSVTISNKAIEGIETVADAVNVLKQCRG